MITLEQAEAYNDRMCWDCIIDPFHSHQITLEGYSLESGLARAMKEVELPKLIILPWGMADVLLWHERKKFGENSDHYPSYAEYEKARTWKHASPKYSVWGYIGVYHGADVLATGLTDYAWITSELDPKFIGGTNTFFLQVAGRNG
jgi:hypothetical protein